MLNLALYRSDSFKVTGEQGLVINTVDDKLITSLVPVYLSRAENDSMFSNHDFELFKTPTNFFSQHQLCLAFIKILKATCHAKIHSLRFAC